jgi:hypothetical protein
MVKKHKILFLPYNKYTDFPVRQYGLGSRDVKNSKESTANAVSTLLEREAHALLYLSLNKAGDVIRNWRRYVR